MSYENATTVNYRLSAAALTGGAGVLDKIIGPAGKAGRLVSITSIVTTNVTVAAAAVLVGISGDTAKFGTASVPISTAGAGLNAFTAGGTNEIPADTVIEIGTDGAATAGAADVDVTIDWY